MVCGSGHDEGEAVDELKSNQHLAISDINSSQLGQMRTFPNLICSVLVVQARENVVT